MKQLIYLVSLWLTVESAVAVQIPRYLISTRFEIATQSIQVSATLSLDTQSGQVDTVLLLLNKNARITSITGGGQSLAFRFDSAGKSPNRYQPDARKLLIATASLPAGITPLCINYDCFLGDMQKAGCAYTPDYIELNYYENWFPYNEAYGSFTFQIQIQLDPTYHFSGAGQVSGAAGNWQLTQSKPVEDIVLIASPRLKTKFFTQPSGRIRVDYFDLDESKADSILTNCRAVYAFYSQLFGPIEKASLTFFINPTRDRTSYARRGFISFQVKGQSMDQVNRGIGHEIGHFWWNRASSDSWEDWLNESFAEYSSLLYLRQAQGRMAFEREIDRYRQIAQPLPPLRGMDRSYAQASSVLYRKGPVILFELEKTLGPEAFAGLLKETVYRSISNTRDFLALISERYPTTVRQRLEAALDR